MTYRGDGGEIKRRERRIPASEPFAPSHSTRALPPEPFFRSHSTRAIRHEPFDPSHSTRATRSEPFSPRHSARTNSPIHWTRANSPTQADSRESLILPKLAIRPRPRPSSSPSLPPSLRLRPDGWCRENFSASYVRARKLDGKKKLSFDKESRRLPVAWEALRQLAPRDFFVFFPPHPEGGGDSAVVYFEVYFVVHYIVLFVVWSIDSIVYYDSG